MKSHMFIKADRQRILLIDCQIIYAINIDHISKQCFSYPTPSVSGSNKQHFKFAPVCSCKSDRATAVSFGNDQMRYI